MKKKIKSRKDENERPISEIDLRDTSDRLKEVYLDRYEGVKSEILSTTRFNENSDLSMTYLGRVIIARENKITAEEKFLISEQGYTTERLLDGTKCQILLDTGTSKSFMSKSHYLHCKSGHSITQVCFKDSEDPSRKWTICECTFCNSNNSIYTWSYIWVYILTSEIHKNVDLVLGIKNLFELEVVINSQECCFSFLNRSIPLFPREKIILKLKEQTLVKVEAPFIDKISGLAIVKILDKLM